jgi:hypothetical protein
LIKVNEANSEKIVRDFIRNNPERKELVEIVANGLFKAWFPKSRPVEDDLKNWIEIAVLDACEAVKALENAKKLNNNTRKRNINNNVSKNAY